MQKTHTKENTKKIVFRNSAIIFCSTLGSTILFSPARHFGVVAITFIMHRAITTFHAKIFDIFCGVASVGATAILGFNSWDKILSLPEITFKALLKRFIFYVGGITCAIPLMIDTFKVNQPHLSIVPNLIFTILPGIFISGVYGQSIEFLYDELIGRNSNVNKNNAKSRPNGNLQKRIALGISFFLGTASAIASYWEGFNILSPIVSASIPSYIISILPVACRAPLFIKSTYSISNKSISNMINLQKLTCKGFTMLIITLIFSLFTIGAYSDIAYNGMTQSNLYQNSYVFRHFLFPSLLGVAMFCMLLLNSDALMVAGERANKYFTQNKYNPRFNFAGKQDNDLEKTPLLEENANIISYLPKVEKQIN